MNRFYVGQKVCHVPIYGSWTKFEKNLSDLTHPVPNGIYTIREICLDINNFGKEVVAIRLKEIVNPIREFLTGRKEVCWDAAEFQPLEEKKTDISIFKKLLNPSKVHENS